MTADKRIRIFVENRAEQLIVEGIFRPEIEAGEVQIDQCWELSSMIGVAQLSLLQHPERPVALVINASDRTQDDVEQNILGPIHRQLSDTASVDWIMVVAYPNIVAWAKSDPRVEEIYAAENLTNKHDQAVRFARWCKENVFDRTLLTSSDSQFEKLIEFHAAHVTIATSSQ